MDKHRQSGFTLVELMVTLGVGAILVGLVVPNMRDFMRNNRLSGGVNDMLHSLQVARTEAIKRQNGNVVVCGTASPIRSSESLISFSPQSSRDSNVSGTPVARMYGTPD